jgi:serine/threonine-protein kinase
VAQLVPLARDLLKGGYDHDATRAALELEERRRREEAESTTGGASPWWTAAAGVAATGIGAVLMSNTDLSDLLQVMGWAMVIGAPSVTLRQLLGRVRGSKFWSRLLRGRLGRWAFKFGGVGIGEVAPPALASGEPTALAIGRAAGELFAALPEPQRQRLADVPELIERLEADVLSLRAGPEGKEQHQRLITAVTALEALRLDLMRLHAGKASLDELTQDIAEARRVGEEIDAEMEGREVVKELLKDE